MTVKSSLPFNFKVGQQVEAKSFEEGYRGAWFRCKIKGCKKGKEPTVALDYIDYNDYKNYWINLYEYHQFPAEKHRGLENKHLMLRPSYPQIYHQSQMPDTFEVLETVGVVDGTWEVGDMVDWFQKDCYWSARITKVLDEKNVEIKLPEPPMGEGETYIALCKDLRPSLDWNPKLGWTLPIFEVGENFRRCVRLMQPKSSGNVRKNAAGSNEMSSYVSSHTSAGSIPQDLPVDSPGKENLKQASVIKIKSSLAEEPSSHSLESHSRNLQNKQKTDTSSIQNDGAERSSWSDSVSSPDGDNHETVLPRNNVASRAQSDSCGSSKKMRKSEPEVNSTSFDTIESSIIGLQELVNRVGLLRRLLD
ncbi:hypothetical protein C5167_044791 [Papaver somniferum]|uniref:uncharacterized protein LOC113335791 isoform X2 n=1 Tax=Papaver somniferum TaxID=3469 RepID=UPI000E705A63|nr:uncharacterized protein LOC113335791 isoform X2 [Papaver somniferum]RZC90161.1 hypothetical protein C5167_044791 [Papaver somniferum]